MLQYLIFPALALLIIWLLVTRFTAVLRQLARNPEARAVLVSAVTLLMGGTYAFHQIEGWRPLDALYFCVISLTTVGYGDLTPRTDAGKVMAITYILLGLGVVMALATTVAQVVMERTRERHDRLISALGQRRTDA